MAKDRTRTGPKPKPNKDKPSVNVGAIKDAVVAKANHVGVGQIQYGKFIEFWTGRSKEILHYKGDLTDDEKAHLYDVLPKLKDEKLKNIITGLIGWGDDERAELETFCAIALEVMKRAGPKIVSEAAMIVDLRDRIKMPVQENTDQTTL